MTYFMFREEQSELEIAEMEKFRNKREAIVNERKAKVRSWSEKKMKRLIRLSCDHPCWHWSSTRGRRRGRGR